MAERPEPAPGQSSEQSPERLPSDDVTPPMLPSRWKIGTAMEAEPSRASSAATA